MSHLVRAPGAAGRPDVMPLALTVVSEAQARFVVGAVETLARHHETGVPLAALEVRGTGRRPDEGGPRGRPRAGRLPLVDREAGALRATRGPRGEGAGAPAGWTVHGYASPEGLIGQPYWILLPPGSRAAMEERRQARLRGELVPVFYEIENVRRDGTVIWVQTRPSS